MTQKHRKKLWPHKSASFLKRNPPIPNHIGFPIFSQLHWLDQTAASFGGTVEAAAGQPLRYAPSGTSKWPPLGLDEYSVSAILVLD